MITNGILTAVNVLISSLLLPIEALNLGIDFLLSLPIIVDFLQIVAYVLPWSNLVPLFIFIISVFSFRIGIAVVKTILSFIPFFG